MKDRLNKIIYGFLFCAVLPLILIGWAHILSGYMNLPEIKHFLIGLFLSLGGLLLIAWSMLTLWFIGKGLPMNGFPPPRYVIAGPYRVWRHPIYFAFSCVCFGFSLITGSVGGFWIVSPLVTLASWALILGYERGDLIKRFGKDFLDYEPFLHVPKNSSEIPDASDRFSVYFLLLLPWLFIYSAIGILPLPADSRIAYFSFENDFPVIQKAEIFYFSAYIMVLLVPLLAPNRRVLRSFMLDGFFSMLLVFSTYVLIPFVAPPREFEAINRWGHLLEWERMLDAQNGANAFPSYHVIWALLAAVAIGARGKESRVVAFSWAMLISLSCIATGQHALLDVVAAVGFFIVIRKRNTIYYTLVRFSEWLGNSLKTYRIGIVRIFNHAIYSFFAGFIGIALVACFLDEKMLWAVTWVGFMTLLGGALWAQLIEGSSRLLRPFGYFGSIIGGSIGALCAPLFGAEILPVLAGFAVASPFIQAVGRLRCLVQGCCHGREIDGWSNQRIGICVTNKSSRISLMSPYAGKPIYPTPLFSIIGNTIMGLFLFRLWTLHSRLTLIMGVYLFLSGLLRFVEEYFRGESQTRKIHGLSEYQWYSIAFVFAGIGFMCMPFSAVASGFHFNWQGFPFAFGIGLLSAFAMSMDFPGSNRRFSRLTG